MYTSTDQNILWKYSNIDATFFLRMYNYWSTRVSIDFRMKISTWETGPRYLRDVLKFTAFGRVFLSSYLGGFDWFKYLSKESL